MATVTIPPKKKNLVGERGKHRVEDDAKKRFEGYLRLCCQKVWRRDNAPEQLMQEYRKVVGLLEPMTHYPPRQQLAHIQQSYWNAGRPGVDCDLGGSWQPLFFAELHRLVAEDAGLDPSFPDSRITLPHLNPKYRAPTKWPWRKTLDGD